MNWKKFVKAHNLDAKVKDEDDTPFWYDGDII
jgi:hypothetical protein